MVRLLIFDDNFSLSKEGFQLQTQHVLYKCTSMIKLAIVKALTFINSSKFGGNMQNGGIADRVNLEKSNLYGPYVTEGNGIGATVRILLLRS